MKEEEKITLTDRLISAAMLAGFIAITLGLLPFALAYVGIGKLGIGLYGFYTTWSYLTLVAVSAIAGFILGVDNSTTLLGHLWCTENPRNYKISFGLWAVILFVALIPYLW